MEAAIEFIEKHSIYLQQTPLYQEMLQDEMQLRGFSLVKTTNLADYYKIQDFCNENCMVLVNNNFG